MWLLIPVAILGALITVLVVDIISRAIVKRKLSNFLNNYKMISLGMSKQRVVEIMGTNYVQNATTDSETLSWSCRTNTAIQRELYSKKEASKTVIVVLTDNQVISYNLQ